MFVYKADGQTVYTRLRVQSLVRGRKYQSHTEEGCARLFKTTSDFTQALEGHRLFTVYLVLNERHSILKRGQREDLQARGGAGP